MVKWKVKPFSTVAGKRGVLAATFKIVVDVIYALRYFPSSPLALFSETVLDWFRRCLRYFSYNCSLLCLHCSALFAAWPDRSDSQILCWNGRDAVTSWVRAWSQWLNVRWCESPSKEQHIQGVQPPKGQLTHFYVLLIRGLEWEPRLFEQPVSYG